MFHFYLVQFCPNFEGIKIISNSDFHSLKIGSRLDKGVVITGGCHAYLLLKVKVHMELKIFFMASEHGAPMLVPCPCSSESKSWISSFLVLFVTVIAMVLSES